jgi:hypothetical protein
VRVSVRRGIEFGTSPQAGRTCTGSRDRNSVPERSMRLREPWSRSFAQCNKAPARATVTNPQEHQARD